MDELKDVRRRYRDILVLHLDADEPRPSKLFLRQFNHVVDAEPLINARARLHLFAIEHAIFHVGYQQGRDDCKLIFDMLGGSQQFTETYADGLEVARECLAAGEWLMLEESNEIGGTCIIRVRQKNLREFQAMKMWGGEHTCVWVRGDDQMESGPGYSSLCLPDRSQASVRQLAHDIKLRRPWMARRTGHRGLS